jgi:hypothetical protein
MSSGVVWLAQPVKTSININVSSFTSLVPPEQDHWVVAMRKAPNWVYQIAAWSIQSGFPVQR